MGKIVFKGQLLVKGATNNYGLVVKLLDRLLLVTFTIKELFSLFTSFQDDNQKLLSLVKWDFQHENPLISCPISLKILR